MRSRGDQIQRRLKFERHPSQVVFDPSSCSFVVTWAKCNLPAEKRMAERKDPLVWAPSISAIAELYDRGCIPSGQVVYAAMSMARAWAAGDRDMLDTESAKKAAELVHDLSSMCVDASSPAVEKDIGQAMRHLLDEMSMVRFAACPESQFEDSAVMPAMERAAAECFSIPEFVKWPFVSMRRRFMFCLNKRERSPVTYSLVSLLFDTGSCPLLPLSDRRNLRLGSIRASGLDEDFSSKSVCAFFRFALGKMRDAKALGLSRVEGQMTQQQLVNSLSEMERMQINAGKHRQDVDNMSINTKGAMKCSS